jgi:ACS family sodium-dependent inorganic phosphate cotransporter
MAVTKRWELILFLFSAATVSYMLRVNVSVCAQKMRDEFGWSDTQKGFVLSAFFWG